MSTEALTAPGLESLPCIHEGRNWLLYLQTDSAYGKPVVIKMPRQDYAAPQQASRLANEHHLTAGLQLPGVRRSCEQLLIDGRPALALEYFEGRTLQEGFVRERRSLAENLEVAIAIATVLEGIHRRNLVHRNLSSAHILVSREPRAVMLIGFGGASLTNGKGVRPEAVDLSESSLAYVSPEQTGRINQFVDQRADLYSFGAVLYEVFTGRLPFDSGDPAELVHCHLAQNPVSPRELDPEVPGVVSDIVMRLLAKNAGERYQSAFGVRADLENCLGQLQRAGRIESLTLGLADYRSVLQLPETLYGREQESRELKDAVKDAGRGVGSVVLVLGPAGVGKTALVEDLQQSAAGLGARFIKGQYDGSQRHVPYAGLIQACGELVDSILTESAGQLAQWKARILEAAGGNGSLLTGMLPRLELVIGPQQPAPELGPAEAQNRFHHLFQNFVLALARRERPLVLFLDNLQWADQASLHLLNLLLPGLDTQPIVFLGGYRNDEVGEGHLLAPLLKTLTKMVRTIALDDLSLDAVSRMIADALKVEVSFAQPLAELVLEKTGGNALFVVQFLQSLHEDGLLKFDADGRRWTWDTDGIRRLEITGSVAALMTQKIEKLAEETQSLLSIAACIGNRFELRTLAEVAESSASEVADRLLAAVEGGLILSSVPSQMAGLGEAGSAAEPGTRFEFAHDRVRQAAYALLPRKQRRLTHLKIGRLLLAQTSESVLEERVFEIADQLNEGFQYLTEERERQQLVALNLAAGRKAKSAAAHQAAIRYLSMGIGMLPVDRWERGSELTLDLFMEAVEAEYLSTNFERAALLSTEVLAHVTDVLTRVRVHELRILFFTAQDQNGPAIQAGLEALDELDMVPPTEEAGASAAELRRELAAVSRIEDLARLPEMTDPRRLAIMRLLMHLTAPAQRTDLALLKAIIGRMVLLSVKHGNSPMAAFAYGWYGALLCGSADDVETGYRFGRLSLEVLRQFHAPEFEAKVVFLFNAYVRHWKEHARECIGPLQDVYRRGVETGDLEYTCYGAIHYCGYLFCTGAPLELVRRKQAEFLETMERSRLPFHSQLARIWGQMVANLCGGMGEPSRLTGELFDESKSLPGWIEENNSLLVFGTLSSRTMLQYLFGDYAGAVASGRLAEDHAKAVQGLLYQANHSFYYALALLAHHATADSAGRIEGLRLAAPLLDQLRQWAALAPMNFAHKLALVEAEHARVAGANGRAMECFNDAIRLSRENGYLQDEALACEREAVFYNALGREDIAELSLRRAVDAFRSWGALRKVEDLERRFKLLPRQAPVPLDSAAVVKASHMLSQEIRLEQLLEKLMHIVIENAGAEKGLLIQKSGAGLVIQARSGIGGGRVETMQGVPVETSGEVALSVVNYVARTQSQVVLGDACRDRTFGTDAYIAERRTRSLLCLPIIYQGKLSGLLYLENDLATDVFTADRLELLKALASQAAISIENAGLYADLEHKIAALEQAEGELRQYRDLLEEQVQARTAELTGANIQLVGEIAERKKAQEALQQAHGELERRVAERTVELSAANARLVGEIEERKRTGEALRQSEQKFRAIFDQTFQFIGVLTIDGILLQANQTALQFAGVSEDAVLGKPFWETLWWAHSVELQQRLRTAVQEAAGGKLVRFEATHATPDGQIRYIDFSLKPVTDANGLVVLLIPEGRDITERKEAEEALRRLNRELRAISTCNEVLVRAEDEQALLDEICRIICDGAGYRMAWVGYAEHDDAKTVRPVARAGVEDGYLAVAGITWEDTERGRGPTGTAIRTGQTSCVQDYATDPRAAPWREPALERGYRSNVALPLKDGTGTTFGALTIYSTEPGAFTPDEMRLLEELASDLAFGITVLRTRAERDRADDALRASEEQYRRFVEDDVAGVYITTPAGGVLTCNPAFARMLGFASVEEGLATNVVTIYQDPAAREALLADLRAQGRVDDRELAWRRRDESLLTVVDTAIGEFDEQGALVAIRGYAIDITERRRLEEQLRQSQKMEAVGRLAGGVAHDFNNLLTAINGYADLLAAGMAPDDERRSDVEEIRKAGDRAAALTRQLLAFSRRQVLQPIVIDLDVVVSGIAPMLRRLVGEQIEFRALATRDLDRVRADPAQIEQVLLNLVVNARDAMPGGGTLTIEMANVELDDDYLRTHPHAVPGPYVQLAVSDTGVGMDAATMAHLFEPFFTTKPAGMGTGLGLATAYGIVTQSGGHITAYSEPGEGSTFRVYLPRVTAAVAPVVSAVAGPAPGGSETILVVEDEDVVRSYAERVLGRLGYAVSAARSGVEALALVADHPGPFDLLVTDVMLPGMNGREISDRLTARQPSLRTLFVSGYTQDAIVHRGVLDAGVAFLAKPFTPDALGRAVRDALEARTAGSGGHRQQPDPAATPPVRGRRHSPRELDRGEGPRDEAG